MAYKIMVADDDPEIRDVIRIYLQNEGYQTVEAEDGKQVLHLLDNHKVDLIILDVMMPVLDGINACFKIRERTNIPIIMLSAKSEDIDKITGLTSGADDYLSKPFNPLELIARVKAQLRRQSLASSASNLSMDNTVIEIDDLKIDRNRHLVSVRGKEISLTPIEFSILELMASHRGFVFNIEKLYQSVWKEDKFLSDNTVMVHIRNIREKIEDNARSPRYIKTVWGVGYKVD
ncbi:response regulator transcription factor [Paenibacillus sp. GSMTC-2017]|uniref:response regulator transcription factor n=1 Tax=Paenibacillus sp. GSMTC-2017 TaxID=2794350 RepID=UPI0018D84765|nr:response regulator transcription factor [Paenibacillus sp. GSMTC-2017]MBH5318345.1 response regulator transcription factor [Paenibacillus sp. GSMTC-2017]